jgi:P27 family predicted phage terminase small subunit
MKGRKPNSENVVPLTGDRPAANFDAFAAQRSRELRPDDLPFDVQAIWDRLAPTLCHPTRDRLNEANAFMFEQLCWITSRYERLRLDVRENGETYTTETRNGEQQKSRPEVGQLNETFRQIMTIARDFGMTPASERGLKSGGQLGFDFGGEADFD